MPPLSFLLQDPSRRDSWSTWDLKLIHAYHINEMFEVNGHPLHIEESKDIIWHTKQVLLRSVKATDEAEEKLQKSSGKNHGVRIVAVPKLRKGAKWPRRHDTLSDKLTDRHAKADEKIRQAGKAAEERARLKIAETAEQSQD